MKEKLVHNRQKADYALIIGRLPIIEKRPIIGRLIGLTDSSAHLYYLYFFHLAFGLVLLILLRVLLYSKQH